MINYKKLLAFVLLFLAFVMGVTLLLGCEKNVTCVTGTIANIIGCNRSNRCRVELKDGTAGWTRDPVTSTSVTVCKRDL